MAEMTGNETPFTEGIRIKKTQEDTAPTHVLTINTDVGRNNGIVAHTPISEITGNFVTLDTDQTISSEKIFEEPVKFKIDDIDEDTYIQVSKDGIDFYVNENDDGGGKINLTASGIDMFGNNYEQVLQSKDGTVALVEDIPDTSNFVTTNTAQTITEEKTFTAPVVLESSGDALINSNVGFSIDNNGSLFVNTNGSNGLKIITEGNTSAEFLNNSSDPNLVLTNNGDGAVLQLQNIGGGYLIETNTPFNVDSDGNLATNNISDSYTVSSTSTIPNTKALVDGLATKQATLTNPVTGVGSNLNTMTFSNQDGTILYHSLKWFTPSGTVSTSGDTVTSVGSQFTSEMVGSKVTINGEWRLITAFTSSTVVTVSSAYSNNYSSVSAGNWGVYNKAFETGVSGNATMYAYNNTSTYPFRISGTTTVIRDLLLSGAPATSAGSFDILTRNTSTGVVEKRPSSSIPLFYTNATTTALTSATLTSTYPSATIGSEVHALSITGGGVIYKKTSTGWASILATVTL